MPHQFILTEILSFGVGGADSERLSRRPEGTLNIVRLMRDIATKDNVLSKIILYRGEGSYEAIVRSSQHFHTPNEFDSSKS